jgi:hypothetical protein
MSQFLREALLELLMQRMADHMQSGLSDDEALMVSVAEINLQIQGGLVPGMIVDAVREARKLNGAKLH